MLPSVKLYKLDLQFIADNCLNKKLWGKKWRIFEYDKITVDLALDSIDIANNKIRLSITVNTKDRGKYQSTSFFNRGDVTIPLDKGQQNMENALRQVVGAIGSNVIAYERAIASRYVGYERASEYDNMVDEEAGRRAESILDEEGITNDEIREAYIESCKDKVNSCRASDFLSESKYIVRPHYYLMLAAYFYPGNDKKYQDALRKTNTNIDTEKYSEYKENMKEFIKAVHEDNTEEYISEMDMDFDKIY